MARGCRMTGAADAAAVWQGLEAGDRIKGGRSIHVDAMMALALTKSEAISSIVTRLLMACLRISL